MSSISGISSGVDLYNILQSSTASTNGVGVNIAAPQTAQDPANDPSSDPDGDGDQQVKGHHHHGHHGLQGQIQSAVTSALQNSNSSEDPNQTIQDAIAAVLKNVDVGGNANGQNGAGPAQASGGSDSTSASQFAQLLQSNGITPQDFQNDLKAAWTDNGSGGQSLNFSTLFQSFPPGTAVDTTA